MTRSRLLGWLAVAVLAITAAADAQTPAAQRPTSLSVFLDCGFRCDEEFIRTEITYVNWVRDRVGADVHVLVTSEGTGGGGTQYTLAFLGLQRYAGTGDTLRYEAGPSATPDETRRGMARVLKVGLVPFVARTTIGDRLQVSVSAATGGDTATSGQTQLDPWNFWVFRLSLNGFFNGDANARFRSMNGSINARRTTQQWKLNVSGHENYNEQKFTIDSATSTFIRRSYNSSQLLVRSLGPRWSAGLSSELGSSTFDNKKLYYRFTPAIEYDIFPYSESTRRMLTLQYGIGLEGFRYTTETIYGKLRESHPLHRMIISLYQNQPWGSANVGLEGGQYLDMTNRNYASVSGSTNFRLFKGFSVNFDGNYSAIRNQLYLPRIDASEQEILLQQRQLATNYQYFFFFGINYTFGSVLNNVVNPRFGRDCC
jgi:hypothetical protein